jgi:hypothetical protein
VGEVVGGGVTIGATGEAVTGGFVGATGGFVGATGGFVTGDIVTGGDEGGGVGDTMGGLVPPQLPNVLVSELPKSPPAATSAPL